MDIGRFGILYDLFGISGPRDSAHPLMGNNPCKCQLPEAKAISISDGAKLVQGLLHPVEIIFLKQLVF
jgi:hypothetical protein